MKNPLRHWAGAAVGAAAALAFSSCVYDPYYNGGGYYGAASGYGDGYGYGNSNFTTSVFVTTGDPRWGYDPYCYSYYDYQRRCYYDPYLNGYYPIGYRPAVVFGVPHPYGWSPGHGYISPPRNVNYGMAVNYRNRESAYRNSNYGWAHQVRTQPAYGGNASSHYAPRNSYNQSNTAVRPATSGGAYSGAYGGNHSGATAQASPGTAYGNPYGATHSGTNPQSRPGTYNPTRPATGNYPNHGQPGSPSSQAQVQGQAQGQAPSYSYSGPNSGRSAAGYSRSAAVPSPSQQPSRQAQAQPRQAQPQPGPAQAQPRQAQPQPGPAQAQPRQAQPQPGPRGNPQGGAANPPSRGDGKSNRRPDSAAPQ